MTARKKTGKSTRRKRDEIPFWERMLSGQKIERVLSKMGADTSLFQKEYLADTSRVRGTHVDPAEWDAVAVFEKSGDLNALMERLSLKTTQSANNVIRRVIQARARGETKVVRR